MKRTCLGDLLLTILSGGTGTPKLLQGLIRVLPREELSIIVNTAEDVEVSNLYVSPDLDTVTYTLAGIINEELWYGIKDDTFHCYEMLKKLGKSELLRIGDKDRAIKLYRTLRLQNGATLSEVTREICEEFGVQARAMPMTNDNVTTEIVTENGAMTFHEFWVARHAKDKVEEVNFRKVKDASPAPGVIEAINESDGVLIGPSNPVTSIGPILKINEIHLALKQNREKVLAVSPVIGNAPVSGPTGVLMKGLGHEASPLGVAKIYRDYAGRFLLHGGDKELSSKMEELGMTVQLADLLMTDISSKTRLAREVLKQMDYSKN